MWIPQVLSPTVYRNSIDFFENVSFVQNRHIQSRKVTRVKRFQNRRIEYMRVRQWWVLPTEGRLGSKARGEERPSLSPIESFLSRA